MNLHLGCGKRYIPGWHHRDITYYPHVDKVGPVEDLQDISIETVDSIYASHVLEYFDRLEANKVLKEWFRVLRPGGTLRLAVPDFHALIRIYNMSGKIESILGPLFGRMTTDGSAIYHRTAWDIRSLTAELEEAGFNLVREYSPLTFLKTLTPDGEFDDHSLAFWPHMDLGGVQVSLCLQATK